MQRDTAILVILLTAFFFLLPDRILADQPEGYNNKLNLFGDVRFRMEFDRDSRNSNGTKREDRDRLRFRLRFGFTYRHNEHFSFGGRLRSGLREAAQSPHITLGDQLEPKSIVIDQAYLKGSWGDGYLWVGKNAFPFWKQNELFWDDDVTLEGITISHTLKSGENNSFTATGGYYVLDKLFILVLDTTDNILKPQFGSNEFSDKASFAAVQVAYKGGTENTIFQAAAGYYGFRDNPDHNQDTRLANLNYNIGVFGANLSLKNWKKPVVFGIDYMQNFKNYPATLFNGDQKTGYLGSIKVGGLNEQWDWLIGYYYAHIEEFAVVARFAQDDWLRWGSATETRSSNFQGHEFRAAIALGAKNNIVARLYLVDAIKKRSATATAKEDGTRFRVDWNMAF